MLDHVAWNNVVDRMLESRLMQDYLFLGLAEGYGFPVVVSRKRNASGSSHTWALGEGATSLFAAPQTTQLIAGGDRSVVIIDLGPHKHLLVNTVEEA